MVLGCDSNIIYVMHANNLSDTSSLLISKIQFQNGRFSTVWTTLVPQIYFDPAKGIKRDALGDVFRSGSPEFRYEWYATQGNILCGIKMLFAFAIDVQTGKLLWKKHCCPTKIFSLGLKPFVEPLFTNPRLKSGVTYLEPLPSGL